MIIPADTALLEQLVLHLATLYDQGFDCVDFDGEPISDPEYDSLYRELKQRKPDSVAFAQGSTSPSQYDPQGEHVIHHPPMTSIAKADGDDKFKIWENWIRDCCTTLNYEFPPKSGRFAQSYKHDGVAIRIYYKNGKLHKAGLRPRNGVKGIDVTENVKYVQGVPENLPLPLTLAIGGELECLHSDFVKVQKALADAGEDLRKNPRNHTYGGINQQKDSTKTKEARISFCGYNITGFDDSHKYYTTEIERAKWCNQVLKVPFVQTRDHRFEDLAKLEENATKLDYETDGVVLKVNNLEDQEQMGHSGGDPTAEPKGALAWKFAEERKIAVVKEIQWKASRTGRIPPVAIFEKGIELAGTIVTRATCSNLGWLCRMGIGPGSEVSVYKAGKIIPKVEKVVKNPCGGILHPTECPACQQSLEIVQGANNNQDLICKNLDCPAKHVVGIVFYLKTMEAKGLGESSVEPLVESGKVKTIADLYELTEQDLLECEFSEREALLALATIHMVKPQKDNLKFRAEIDKARHKKKKVLAWQFFAALGIKRAGKTIGKLLIDKWQSFDKIRTARWDELLAIDGIGDTTADSIVEYFQKNNNLVFRLLSYLELELPKTGRLSGQSFVLSGSFDEGKSHFEKMIQDEGGKISSSVSKHTTYLVAGPGSGSKSDKAKELGVQILDVEGLKKLL